MVKYMNYISERKKRLGSVCGMGDVCLDENAVCEDGICKCRQTFYEDRDAVCSMYISLIIF